MRKMALTVVGLMIAASFAVVAVAQNNPRATTQITLKGKTVSVEYGRPALKGRSTDELLGRLQPGGFWRLGADTSTTFKTGVDLAFGDVTVPAGEYSLWMEKESANSWKLVFNKQHGQWGTEHNAAQDFAKAPLATSTVSTPVDLVTLTLKKAGNSGTLTIQWGTLEAVAHFTAK